MNDGYNETESRMSAQIAEEISNSYYFKNKTPSSHNMEQLIEEGKIKMTKPEPIEDKEFQETFVALNKLGYTLGRLTFSEGQGYHVTKLGEKKSLFWHTDLRELYFLVVKDYNLKKYLEQQNPTTTSEAQRSKQHLRFDLIPPEAIIAIADVLSKGAEKYGEYNWQKNRMTGEKSPINHAMKHITHYQAGIPDEDGDDKNIHLKHAIVNLIFEYWYNLKGK